MAIPNVHWLMSGAAFLLLGLIAFFLRPHAAPNDWWMHGMWCVSGLLVAAPSLRHMFSGGIDLVLQDHRLMFLAAYSLYFLIGASLLAFGPADQIDLAIQRYPVVASTAMRVDGMNSLGLGVALIVTALSTRSWLGTQTGRIAQVVSTIPTRGIMIGLLVVGLSAYLIVLPYDLGFRDGAVSGTVRNAGKLPMVAVVLIFMQRGRFEGWWYALGVVTAIVMSATGLLLFSKSDALLPLAALTAGLGLRFGTRRILPLGLAILISGYLLLGNLSLYGRYAIGQDGGVALESRWQVVREGWALRRELTEQQGSIGWARLCYLPVQAAGMDFWDAGNGGDGFMMAGWVFVPRLLAPGKPEISKTGRELFAKLTGRETSAEGLGVFVSGYYHGGWPGFLIASALGGWILARTSAIARAVQRQGGGLLLPLSLLGMFIAFRIDGDILVDYLGPFVWLLYPLLLSAPVLTLRRHGRSATEPGPRH